MPGDGVATNALSVTVRALLSFSRGARRLALNEQRKEDSSMSELTAASSLAEWVARCPETAPVLERYRLDYCCGGRQSLEAACVEQGLDQESVLEDIKQAHQKSQSSGAPPVDWSRQSLTDLCNHIEQTHHAFLRTQLPRVEELVTKVVAAHGDRHPELSSVSDTFRALAAELGPHLMKEEQVLFPAIRLLESSESTPQFPFGSIENPIGAMEHEHDAAGGLLHKLRYLTGDYTPPDDACPTWRQLLEGLHALELDLHQHIHKENNLLFPAAARRAPKE